MVSLGEDLNNPTLKPVVCTIDIAQYSLVKFVHILNQTRIKPLLKKLIFQIACIIKTPRISDT